MTRQVSVTLSGPEYQKARALDITISALFRELLYNAPLEKP